MEDGIRVAPGSFMLVVGFATAINTYLLYRKRQRGELASYDGQESPVTAFQVSLSAAFSVVCFATLAYQWLTRR